MVLLFQNHAVNRMRRRERRALMAYPRRVPASISIVVTGVSASFPREAARGGNSHPAPKHLASISADPARGERPRRGEARVAHAQVEPASGQCDRSTRRARCVRCLVRQADPMAADRLRACLQNQVGVAGRQEMNAAFLVPDDRWNIIELHRRWFPPASHHDLARRVIRARNGVPRRHPVSSSSPGLRPRQRPRRA